MRSKFTDGFEVAEVRPGGRDALVVLAPQHLRAAQRVLDRLLQQVREQLREGQVPQLVEEAHRARLHRVHEPRPLDVVGLPARRDVVERREIYSAEP